MTDPEVLTRIERALQKLAAAPPRPPHQYYTFDASMLPVSYNRFGGVSFGGISACQYWCDFVLWEALLNENPELRGIIEIGTCHGGFSFWLNAQAEARRIHFRTFDAIEPERSIPNFSKLDVFADPDVVGELCRSWEPVVLFCDCGNRPLELAIFPCYLTDPRSLVVVHDWGTEVIASDVPDGLEEVYGDYCDELGSISRVFRLKSRSDRVD